MLSESAPAEAYCRGMYIVCKAYMAPVIIKTAGKRKTGTDWEHLCATYLKSHAVKLAFEPLSIWLSLCAMLPYLYQLISFDYKIHHQREEEQSERCTTVLQFLYRVPRIIILNNFLRESSISKALPYLLPWSIPAIILWVTWRLRKSTSVTWLPRVRDVTSALCFLKLGPCPPRTNWSFWWWAHQACVSAFGKGTSLNYTASPPATP